MTAPGVRQRSAQRDSRVVIYWLAGSLPLANRWALGRHGDEESNTGAVPQACWWESWGRWRRTCTVHESELATGMRTSTWRRYEGCGPAQPTRGPGTPTLGPSFGPFFEHPKPPFSPSSYPMSLKPHLPMNSLRLSRAVPQVHAILLSLFLVFNFYLLLLASNFHV